MKKELLFKIELAVELLTSYTGLLTREKIITLFKQNGITDDLAKKVYIFLPIVFCKNLLPSIAFPKTYIEQKPDGKQIRKKFDENDIYKLIEISADSYFAREPDGEIVLKIASLSSEFKAVNDLLNKGGELERIKLTETIIIF
ncbi:hypothetical protein [Gilvibacter sediminis]|uniref:hypothetical protein n=1 Tax=Gilvibacter sediminis TaxID=379071 RepID=UPI0023505138|nr:hypothetical protein [Gilvibacter sediminis]MDC7996892.1 hypothetical protein [Gilvibacter sediminis]